MRKYVCLLAISICTHFFSFSQPNPNYLFFFNGNDITSVVPVFGSSTYLIGSRFSGLGIFHLDSMKYLGLIQKISAPIPSHNILALRKFSNDVVWICTDKGLVQVRSNQYTIFDSRNSPLPSDIVNDIYIDALGIWWIATDRGLVSKNDTVWTVYTPSNSGIPSEEVFHVNVDPVGNVWVATPFGLGMYDRSDWYVFNTSNSGLPDNFITFIEFDNFNNSKWIGTLQGGLVHWVGNNFFVYDTSNSALPSNLVTCFAFDTAHNKWVGTSEGLVYISPSGWQVFNTSNSGLSDDFINFIHVDALNRKMICTRNKLTVIHDTNFVIISFENSKLPSNYIQKVVEGIDLVKWIATPDELVSYDGDNWTVYNSLNSPITHQINDIAIDSDNNLWVATDSGLFVRRFKTNDWLSYYYDTLGLISSRVTKVLPTTLGVWIGTDSGLVLYNGGNWIRYDTTYGAKFNGIITSLSSKMVEDSIGTYERIYVGLGYEGIAIFERDTVRFIDDTNSPFSLIYITDVKEDISGKLFVGSLDQGLYTYDSLWLVHNPLTGSFPGFTVKSITFDRFNRPWVTTLAGGIWTQINDTTSIVITEDGYPFYTNEFNDVFVDLSNNKWISTSYGLYVFNEDTIKPELKLKPYDFEVCQDNIFTLSFYSFFLFREGNSFLVKLSDTTGRFDTTIIIGSIQSRSSRPIRCYIPKITSPSTKYKLQIVSTNPPLISHPSGMMERLVVRPLPVPKISGDSVICSSEIAKLWAIRQGVGSDLWTFVWRVDGGELLSPPTNDTILVRFQGVSYGTVVLNVYNSYGCVDSTSAKVWLSNPPGKILYGQNRACAGDAFIYSTTDTSNIRNIWTVVNGTLVKKLANNVVIVRWDNSGTGYVKLKRVNLLGCADSISLKVDIFPTPTAEFAGKSEVMVEEIAYYIAKRKESSTANKWSVVNGIIVGPSDGDTLVVGWPNGGFGKVKLLQRTPSGCSDSSEKIVRVFEHSKLAGDTLVCENSETYYEAISNLGANNQWYVTNGTITSNPQNRRVWVRWGAPGTGRVKLVQTVPNTFFKDSFDVVVKIAAVPSKPFIVDSGGYLYSSSPFGNQWYWNGQMLYGDTNRTIVPLRTGYYTVKVKSAPNCESEFSDPFYFVSGVDDEASGVVIYPNPSSGVVFVTLSEDIVCDNIIVKDLLGVELLRQSFAEISQNKYLDLSNLSTGTYLITMRIGNKEITKRVVLIK